MKKNRTYGRLATADSLGLELQDAHLFLEFRTSVLVLQHL